MIACSGGIRHGAPPQVGSAAARSPPQPRATARVTAADALRARRPRTRRTTRRSTARRRPTARRRKSPSGCPRRGASVGALVGRRARRRRLEAALLRGGGGALSAAAAPAAETTPPRRRRGSSAAAPRRRRRRRPPAAASASARPIATQTRCSRFGLPVLAELAAELLADAAAAGGRVRRDGGGADRRARRQLGLEVERAVELRDPARREAHPRVPQRLDDGLERLQRHGPRLRRANRGERAGVVVGFGGGRGGRDGGGGRSRLRRQLAGRAARSRSARGRNTAR